MPATPTENEMFTAFNAAITSLRSLNCQPKTSYLRVFEGRKPPDQEEAVFRTPRDKDPAKNRGERREDAPYTGYFE